MKRKAYNKMKKMRTMKNIRKLVMLLAGMMVGGGVAWGQSPVEITTDDNGNGTIEESEKKFYLIQTNAFPSFYIAPQANNTITTNNILGEYMLWYFLDAGEDNGTQYYYIVNNSTGKYIYNHNGNSRGINITDFAALSDADKEKCKFKLVVNNNGGTTDFYNICVKADQTYYGLNKQGGSETNANPIRLTNSQYINDSNSKWKFVRYNGTYVVSEPPFTPSTDSEKHYYKIHNIQKDTYFASTDATPDKVIFTNQANESRAWYLKEAASDTWYKYYYIINPATGGKYMYYNGTANNTSDQTDAVSVKAYDSGNEDRYQFVVVQAARGDGNGRVPCYAIIPKLLIDNLWTSSSIGYAQASITNGLSMGIINSRGATNGAHWNFIDTTFTAVCGHPVIAFDRTTGKASITTTTLSPSIYYTTDGTTPSSTNGTLYNGAFTLTEPTTVKAIVTKDGYTNSAVTTLTIYKVATPTIQQETGTHNVSITTATPGATIYYTIDGTTPTTSSTLYEGASEELGGKPIKAIAVKDGMINSDIGEGTVDIKCATPVISFNNITSMVTITCGTEGSAIHYTTDNSEPTTTSTEYSGPFSVTSPTTVKAIATHENLDPSVVAELVIPQVATPTIQNNGSNAISITSATEGATIYYTTDGSTPTISSTVYTEPLTENVSNVTIMAIAVKENMITSGVGSGSVMLQCATPVITRVGLTFTLSRSMPTDASLYYTLEGGSETTYDGPVSFTTDQLPLTVTAVARHNDYTQSETATLVLTNGTGTPSDPYLIYSNSDFANFVANVNSGTTASACYKLGIDVSASGSDAITTTFTGTFDGDSHTISDLSNPLFNTVNDGVVKNVTLKSVAISSEADTVGAIACVAMGYSRIYNCGILPNSADFPAGTHPTVTTTGNCAGGLVGSLRNDSRVVNCFSYADVQASNLAAGIVGRNTFASDASKTDGKYANLRTMVVNCMFYGNITASSVYPVYGGLKISNTGADAINNYNFYRVGCTFTGTFADYNCSWPAQIDYLTRYEFHRNLLNSNRELCGWWVGAPSAPSTMAATDVQAVPKDASLMAKWVLDPSIAPYPILKPFGKYSSPVNIDADADWRISANEWEGKKLGTLSVTINPGSHAASGITTTSPIDFVITDMDTIHGDHCYRKIQLPYYNTVFGNPNGATWDAKYGGNYGDYVVVGWKVSTTEGTEGTLTEDWQTGYNFADRNCTAKDANRVFAQGGYYYVPNGVNNITITAQWATAIYLDNGADHSYDRVNFADLSNPTAGTHFAPAGTRPTTLSNGKTAVTGNIKDNLPTGSSVYEKAIVLVGNHQYRMGGKDIGNSSNACTIMSADFDFDDEPDYSLIWQLGQVYARQSFCPIRFDFLPVMELGIAMKIDGSTQLFALGCYRPLGHFEVTETSLIRFGQFEFSNKNRTVYAPLILNGGIYEQYTKGTNNNAFGTADDKITYIIIGGNVRIPSFTPGAHVSTNANFPTRHCAVNVIGGSIDNLYLTGNYNNNVTPNTDNPHCYIDGGRIKQVAAAGKEGINGDVYFKINHSKIWEFYGGSTLADKRVTGSIDVTIDSSIVTKYCGGPKFGDMYYNDNKTITTRATGTTFTYYYGGGNGGTSYVQHGTQQDNTTTATGYNWNGTSTNQGHVNEYVPRAYINEATGYRANYDMEIVNVSTGTEAGNAVFRTYFYAAQFSATNTGPISNTLTGCKVLKNFYGAGNLGGVYGDVTSELTDTEVDSLAFGAGFSASIPQVTIHNDKTPPTIDIHTGIITPQLEGNSTTYTWCYENPETHVVVPQGVTIPAGVGTGNPAFTSGGKNYFYTTVSLEGLGTVRGDVTLTLKGNSKVGTQGHAETGNVYGGGDESAVDKNASDEKGNTTVKLQGNTTVRGSVYGGGNKGIVGGNSSVTLQ